ncbi:MAG: hypothetical protein AAGA30_01955 [Planctomycetota bacterium]
MARDIEEFLRKAAERRRQQQQKQRGPTPSERVRELVETGEIEVVQPIEVVEPVPVQKTRVAKPIRDLREQSISEHVRSHIDTSDISEHASHLGERIQNADDRIAARLNRKFDHDVSKLDDLPTVQDDQVAGVTKDSVSPIASDLVEMLRTPKNIRQAILVSEILKRPELD